MDSLNTFDDFSAQRIAETVRRLDAQVRNLRKIIEKGDRIDPRAREIRTGITTTNATHSTYPTSGSQFVVQFEDWDHDETPGVGSFDSSDWAQTVVARNLDGKYVPEGTRVELYCYSSKTGRRWWFRPINTKGRVVLGIVQSASGYHRDYTPPLPYISTNQQFDVKLVNFTETSTGSGIWQLERTDTVVKAIQVSSFPLPIHTLVMLLQPETEDAPWIAIPNISPACRWQIMAHIEDTSAGSGGWTLTDTYTKLNSLSGVSWVNTEEPVFPTALQYETSAPVYPDRDGITVNAPGVYRISLWGECWIDPSDGSNIHAVDIAIGDTSESSPWTVQQIASYAVVHSQFIGSHMIPRVSTIVAIDADGYDFPRELSVFARFRGYTSGQSFAQLRWVRIHVEPAAIGENQSDVGFPGWEDFTTTPAPTTAPPTTAGPTTAAPTTAAPTTAAPTTAAPTTAAPTTAAPTTAAPTTGAPTTGGPTTAGPTTSGAPVGGCCDYMSNTCLGSFYTEADCIAAGGLWLGEGFICPTGASGCL